MPASCPFNDSEVIACQRYGCGTGSRTQLEWLSSEQHTQDSKVGAERDSSSEIVACCMYAPTPPNGCVLRRTPILAWALLDTLERHPSLPDVSVLFNWCADACMHQRPCLVHDHRLGLSFV